MNVPSLSERTIRDDIAKSDIHTSAGLQVHVHKLLFSYFFLFILYLAVQILKFYICYSAVNFVVAVVVGIG